MARALRSEKRDATFAPLAKHRAAGGSHQVRVVVALARRHGIAGRIVEARGARGDEIVALAQSKARRAESGRRRAEVTRGPRQYFGNSSPERKHPPVARPSEL